MRTISVRELRAQSAKIWRALAQEKELVITSNGKPVGLLSAVSEDTLEASLAATRRARAMLGVLAMQLQSMKQGRDQISSKEINAEIASVRKNRSRRAAA